MTKLLRSTTQQNAPLSIMGHFKVLTIIFVSLFLTKNPLLAQTWVQNYDINTPLATSVQSIAFGDTAIALANNSKISLFKNDGNLIWNTPLSSITNTTMRIFGIAKSIDNQNIIAARVQYSNGVSTSSNIILGEYNLSGQLISEKILRLPLTSYPKPSLVKLDDGFLISDGATKFTAKIDAAGDVLWTSNTGAFWANDKTPIVLANKNILKFGLENDSINNRTKVNFIEIANLDGHVVDSANISIPRLIGNYSQAIATKDNGIVVLRNMSSSLTERQIVASKLDLRRRYLQNQSLGVMKDTLLQNYFQVNSDSNGNIYVLGTAQHELGDSLNLVYLFAFTPDANFRASRIFRNLVPMVDNLFYALSGITVTPSGSLYISGGAPRTDFLVRLDSFGAKFYGLQGRVVRDNNHNCQSDTDDTPLSNWLVQAIGKKSGLRFFELSDSIGFVNFGNLPNDTYRISTITTNFLWQNCNESTVFFNNTRDINIGDFAIQPLTDCAVMETDVSIPFLRRCFDNVIFVSYRNAGAMTAPNARITVKLDSLMEYVSATRPLSSRVGNLLTFEIGDVPESAYNRFNITARVRCGDSTRLGQTLCVEARAYPDTLCTPISTAWTGANIVVSSSCQNDSIYFYIKNTGRGTTATGIHYIVIEDDIVFMQGTTPILIPNASKLIRLPATGKTYRVVADQEINHPLSESQPTVAVEGCVSNGQSFTTGFVNQFTESDEALSLDIECREVRGAFDPNDKTGLPKGYDNQHFIQKGNDIEYMIRFQNTGTDTAFTVIVRDTLPYNQLDPTTVKVGASSHPFLWQIMDKGVLEFRFDNIMLPDSFTNKLGSNGFVKFRISQKANLAEGTKIENRAGIYFDFNAPVITNRTLHTIATTYKTQLRLDNDEVTAAAKIRIAPNPFGEQTVIDITESTPSVKTGIFELFDLNGKLLRHEKFENNRFEFHKKDLPTGIFIFKISTVEGRLIGQGKVVAQ